MATHILSLIQEQYKNFSKGQKRIANYILESYDKAAFMTASKLGKTAGVSESTVVRFAVDIGYGGYPEMQKSLQALVRTKLTSIQRIEVSNSRLANHDILSSVIQADMDALRMTSETLDRTQLEKSVEHILSANHIYIVGVRSSASIANFLNFYLRNMFENVRLVTSTASSEMFEQMLRVKKGDVVIGVSLPRYSTRTVNMLKYAKNCGATTISITDKLESPAGKASDFVLAAKSDMVSIVDSLVAPMSVVNALIVMISRKQEQTLTDTYKDLEKLWEEYDVYEHVE